MFNRFLTALALSASAALGLAHTAQAQVINFQESATPYAEVRGWSVFSIGDGRGLNSCRAVTGGGYDGQMMIDYGSQGAQVGWTLYVVANRTANDGGVGIRGAAVYFDNRLAADAQSGFGIPGADGSSSTHAGINFGPALLRQFKAASSMRIDINGEAPRSFSLHGSTAAVLKVEECAQRYGLVASATPAPSTQVTRVDGYSVGYVRYPGGQFRNVGGDDWVEEGDGGGFFNFRVYDVGAEGVFLNDASRDLQIWLDLANNDILFTQNFDNNTWNLLYRIDCAAVAQGRSC